MSSVSSTGTSYEGADKSSGDGALKRERPSNSSRTSTDSVFESAKMPASTPESEAATSSDQWTGSRGRKNSLIWTEQQDASLINAVRKYNGKNWKAVAEMVGLNRSNIQCKHRWQKVLDPNLVKGPWSPDEDRLIVNLITQYGAKRWSFIAEKLRGRTGKQCRERWVNQLDPSIKKEPWSPTEDSTLQEAHARLGNKWAEIAKLLPGRSENAVKNRWHGSLRRNMVRQDCSHSRAPCGSHCGGARAFFAVGAIIVYRVLFIEFAFLVWMKARIKLNSTPAGRRVATQY